jgi:hypothetical protein
MAPEGTGGAKAPLDSSRLTLAFLRGSARARGRQLGEHLAAQGAPAARQLRFWLQFPLFLMRSRMPGMPAAACHNAARLADALLVRPLVQRQSSQVREGVRGFAEGLGGADLGLAKGSDVALALLHAHAMYDAVDILASPPFTAGAPAARLGCSSLVVLPALSESGELLHGRNLDILQLGAEVPPLVAVHHPDEGLPYVALHHGGGYTGGITATNAAGLTLGVHQNFTRRHSLLGWPVLAVADELVRTCKSLTSALELLQVRPTAGGWTFVVSDAKSGRAAAFEMDADGCAALYPPGGFLAVANCFRTSKEVHDAAPSGAFREHNWCRLSRLNALARQSAGRHEPQTVAAALGDHTDAYDVSRQRPYGNVVSALHNLDAVVVSPGLDALWVAVGKAPRNSADGYVGLRLSALFEGRTDELAALSSPVPRGAFQASLGKAADAAAALFEGDDRLAALDLLEQAAGLAPEEPMHRLLRGSLLLAEGHAHEANEQLLGTDEEETSPYRRALGALMRGRALDVLGQRHRARALYGRSVELAAGHEGLARQARRAHARGFSRRGALRLWVDVALGDVGLA